MLWQQKYEGLQADTHPLLLEFYKKDREKTHEAHENLAVLFLDLKGFSKMRGDQQRDAVAIVRHIATELIKRYDAKYPNTWGDAVVAGFKDPNAGLECAYKLNKHLEVEGFAARIGMSYGEVFVSYDPVKQSTLTVLR